jgi:hypothetical protein
MTRIATLSVGFLTSCPMSPDAHPCYTWRLLGGVAKIGVVTLGVGFQTLCPVASRSPSVLNVTYLGDVVTLGVDFPVMFPMVSRVFGTLNKASLRGAAKIGVATLGVGFPTSYPMASGGTSVPNMASCGGVAMLGVGFRLCPMSSRGSPMLNMASRHCCRDARRRLFSVVSDGTRRLTCAKCGLH